jgi:hypothetical protein
MTEATNQIATNLAIQVRGISAVERSVAEGDLSKRIIVEASGEILELKETINLTDL